MLLRYLRLVGPTGLDTFKKDMLYLKSYNNFWGGS
jgi:hypothetical protein